MDELEFRRRVLTQPQSLDQELIEASQLNSNNQKFVDDIVKLDDHIKTAMQIEVPNELATKLLNTTMMNDSSSNNGHSGNIVQGRFVKRAMSMAASVAFVVGLLVGQVNWSNIIVPAAHASLAHTAIQHVIDESHFVLPLDEQVTNQQLNAKMTPFAFQFKGAFPYHVYYLNHCSFGDQNAVHMVFKGQKGKVTLFFTAQDSNQATSLSEQGMTSMVVPMKTSSMILVGEEGEDLNVIAQQLERMLYSKKT